MRSRSAWLKRRRSAVLGSYWRDSPLAFSLLARCHGLGGSQKSTGISVSAVNRACSAISLPWSQVNERRSPIGEPIHGSGERRSYLLGPPTGRQGDQQDRSAGPFDQGDYRRGALAEHQVTFPVASHGPFVDLHRPLADRDGVDELPRPCGRRLPRG
jgi:hypothetical protein